ncbi:MAG: DUF2207 domain-containing protein, partial [Acidimicrobiales bacterium]
VARHGIERSIPVRFHYDDRYDRVYPLHNVEVQGDAGTPDGLKRSSSGRNTVLRIGDPDRTITGRHTYTIDYDVAGALNGFDTHDELYWNAIGTEWSVAVAQPTVRVSTPGPITRVACFAGPERSNLPCGSTTGEPGASRAGFANQDLPPFSGLTVVVAMAKGTVAEPHPVLDERFSLTRAFAVTSGTVGASGAIALLGTAGVAGLVWRRGRDRRPSATDAEPSSPVSYRPPEGMRPAQMGLLLDETADPLDVTATIVDLAVRGYLSIEELERRHRWSRRDWRLTRLREDDNDLVPYEAKLLKALFKKGTPVELSELRHSFGADLKKVQERLYTDAVHQGWFTDRPDRVRRRWLVLSILAIVLGVGVTVALAATTHLGLLGLAAVLVGLVLLALHGRMPARTAKGAAALRQARGFRRYIETAEVERMRFAEEENIFARYLPYAIVLGATRKWAQAFDGLDEAERAAATSWYISPHGFHSAAFATSLESFSDRTSGIITSTPASSGGSGFSGGGGGFSGGGGGGGGGGSW